MLLRIFSFPFTTFHYLILSHLAHIHSFSLSLLTLFFLLFSLDLSHSRLAFLIFYFCLFAHYFNYYSTTFSFIFLSLKINLFHSLLFYYFISFILTYFLSLFPTVFMLIYSSFSSSIFSHFLLFFSRFPYYLLISLAVSHKFTLTSFFLIISFCYHFIMSLFH